jgi:DDE superfamily endonuclease
MSTRLPAPPAPGPLEAYAAAFDPCFAVLAQRCGFREYLQGLLLPRDRNKTLTALAGAEPITQAQAAPVQRLQSFLSESTWNPEVVQQQRLAILLTDPATRPHEQGALIIDETGDRKAGTKTAHVARQYLGSLGKVDNGIVAVTSLWADEQLYYPLHVQPYEPAKRLPKGKKDPAFRTKPQIGMALVDAALAAGIVFRAVVADCGYGESAAFEGALWEAGVPYVVGLKPSKGVWAPAEDPHTPQEAAQRLRWNGADDPQDWTPVVRRFRDGHTETWWAAELTLAGYGPNRSTRLVVTTNDPATLPEQTTWYLATNLPRPGSCRAEEWPAPPADLEEIARLYGLRNWVEQSYKQAKQELGWADFQVRQDRAIQRHWALVCCAFSFCWWARFHGQEAPIVPQADPERGTQERRGPETTSEVPDRRGVAGEKRRARSARLPAGRRDRGRELLARGAARRAALAGALAFPLALLAGVERCGPAAATPGATGCGGDGPSSQLVSPVLTK